MAPRKQAVKPQFKLWLTRDGVESGFGDGKWRLLQAIDREGSLRAAAAALDISYRKAWGDLKKAEECLGVTLIKKHRGGVSGGETRLTSAGKQWVAAYGRFHKDIEKEIRLKFGQLSSTLSV